MAAPEMGAVVHYVEYDGGPCRHSFVTERISDTVVHLFTMTPSIGCAIQSVPEGLPGVVNTWHLPE